MYKSYTLKRKVNTLQDNNIQVPDTLSHDILNNLAKKHHLLLEKKRKVEKNKIVMEKRMLSVNKTKVGIRARGRAGSTQNGAIHSYVYHHTPTDPTTDAQLNERDKQLGINHDKCYWCGVNEKEALDHTVPVSCPKYNIIGTSFKLNMIPSCNRCNSQLKQGKPPEVWYESLTKLFPDRWTPDKINKLKQFIDINKNSLFFDESVTQYMFGMIYPEIQRFHITLENTIESKGDLREKIIYKDDIDSTLNELMEEFSILCDKYPINYTPLQTNCVQSQLEHMLHFVKLQNEK